MAGRVLELEHVGPRDDTAADDEEGGLEVGRVEVVEEEPEARGEGGQVEREEGEALGEIEEGR